MAKRFSKIHHAGVVVRDMEASAAWYVEHLGFERLYAYGWPGVSVAFLGHGDIRIELFQNEQATPMSGDRRTAETNLMVGGINHFALEVGNLDAAIEQLRANGVEIMSPPKEIPNSGGDRFAFVHDNEQMLIELIQSARRQCI